MGNLTKGSQSTQSLIIEAWGQGFYFGAILMLMLIVLCNLKRGVLLHKVILLEHFTAIIHATAVFMNDPTWGWYSSSTLIPLYVAYFSHNLIAWMKIRPFLDRRRSTIFVSSLLLMSPYWPIALWSNYEHYNGLGHDYYPVIRPWETLARDPWWIASVFYFFFILKEAYNYSFWGLIRTNRRFSVLVFCMAASILLSIIDIALVITEIHSATVGINPCWKLSLVFKCASDTIFLDDFKRVFAKLSANALQRTGSIVQNDPHTHSFLNISRNEACTTSARATLSPTLCASVSSRGYHVRSRSPTGPSLTLPSPSHAGRTRPERFSRDNTDSDVELFVAREPLKRENYM